MRPVHSKDVSYLRWADEGAQLFSTCERMKYCALIVSKEGRVIGTGYNGSPPSFPHCEDGACPHSREPKGEHNLPCIALHAETNALLYSDFFLRLDGTIYVNGVPCYDCAVKIAGSGLKRVVYLDDGSRPLDGVDFLMAAGIKTTSVSKDVLR